MSSSATWSLSSAAGVPGRGEYLKAKAEANPTSLTSGERCAKILVRFAGEADDEIGGERNVRPRAAHALDDRKVVFGAMAAIHRSKHSVGPRLHGQMQIRRQFLVFGVGADKLVVHVERVRSHIAQPQHAPEFLPRVREALPGPRAAPSRRARDRR